MPQGCVCVDAPQVGTNATLLNVSQVTNFFGTNLSAVQSLVSDLSGMSFSALVTLLNQTAGAGLSAPLQQALSSAIDWRRCNGTFSVPQSLASKYDSFQKVCDIFFTCPVGAINSCSGLPTNYCSGLSYAYNTLVPNSSVFDLFVMLVTMKNQMLNYSTPSNAYLRISQQSMYNITRRMFNAKMWWLIKNRTDCMAGGVCIPSYFPAVETFLLSSFMVQPTPDVAFDILYPPIEHYP